MVRLNFSRAPSGAIGSFKIFLSGEFAWQPVIIFALNKRKVGMVTHKPHIKRFAALHASCSETVVLYVIYIELGDNGIAISFRKICFTVTQLKAICWPKRNIPRIVVDC